MRGVPLRIQAPDGAAVSVVGTQPLPVDGVPHVGVVVLSGAEQEVPRHTVLDLRDRPLVPVHHQRLHFAGYLGPYLK